MLRQCEIDACVECIQYSRIVIVRSEKCVCEQ